MTQVGRKRATEADSPTHAPSTKRRRGASSSSPHEDEEEELTQDGTVQTQTTVPSGALDLFTAAQEAAWEQHVAQALQHPKDGAISDASDDTWDIYGTGEAALSKEQLRARHLQQITRLSQVYQMEYWALLEELRARANPPRPPTSPAGRPTRASSYRPLRDIFEVKEVDEEALTVSVRPLPMPSTNTARDADAATATPAAGRTTDQQHHLADEHTAASAVTPARAAGGPVADDAPTQPSMPTTVHQVVLHDHRLAAPAAHTSGGKHTTTTTAGGDDKNAAKNAAKHDGGVHEHHEGDGEEHVGPCGRGLDANMPTYERVEQWLLTKHDESAAAMGLSVTTETLIEWRTAFVQRLPALLRMEQMASAITARALDTITLPRDALPSANPITTAPPRPFNALGVLLGRSRQYLLLKAAVEMGRRSKTKGEVDLDLGKEPDACKLSRRTARIVLLPDGRFELHNVGRRNIRVNDSLVYPGARVALPHLSLVSIVNVHLLFMVNFCATSRLTERTSKLVQMV